MSQAKGSLYLIPCPIGGTIEESIPQQVIKTMDNIDTFVVERAKTARRYIKKALPHKVIQELNIFEMHKDDYGKEIDSVLSKLTEGTDIGLLSEAGCPAVADPGTEVVAWCHRHDIKVVPLVGPNSIIQALMSSGFSGQQFAFHGYLSAKKHLITRQLQGLQSQVNKEGSTHIFMDAPYRNKFLLESCISSLRDDTLLSIAVDINEPTEWTKTWPIRTWKKYDGSKLHKRPAIFSIGRD